MTCIAGVVTDNSVSIGGDYLCVSLEDGSKCDGGRKCIESKNGWVIGIAGSSRAERYISLFRTKHPKAVFTCIEDVYKLTDWLLEEVFPTLVQEEPDTTDFPYFPFELLVASVQGLWIVESDLSVIEVGAGPKRGYNFAAIGSGSQCALGAMTLLEKYAEDPPVFYPTLMEVVSKHNATVGKDAWWRKFE